MFTGTIIKTSSRGFGFIQSENYGDVFFHMSELIDVPFDELRLLKMPVEFDITQVPGKRPQATRVRPRARQ